MVTSDRARRKAGTRPNLGGRPSLSGKPTMSPRIAFRVPGDILVAVERAASAAGQTISAWARDVIRAAVGR